MNPKERTKEFNKLFDAIPRETNVEKINFVCEIAVVKPNTVRIWRMENPPRSPSALVLKVMREAIKLPKKSK